MNKYLLLFCASILLFSCNDKTTEEKLEEQKNEFFKFREHIDQVTDEVISVADPITIKLTEPIAGWTQGMELSGNLIALSPSIAGKTTALDASTISFKPVEPLQQDKEYEVRFQLGKIKEVEDELSTFNFLVRTIKQDFIVRTEAVAAYDRDYQYINGSITASDVMSLTSAKSILRASMNDVALDIKYDANPELGTYFQFKIDSIQRPVSNEEITLKWNGAALDVEEKGENVINITGKDNFEVTDVEAISGSANYILVSFSDPLKKNQNLDGLIQIATVADLSFEIDGNQLKVFPSSPLNGSQQLEVFKGIVSTDGYKLKEGFYYHHRLYTNGSPGRVDTFWNDIAFFRKFKN